MHRGTFEKSKKKGKPPVLIPMPDGRKIRVWDMRWDEFDAALAEVYRDTRTSMDNGRGGTVKDTTVNRELSTAKSLFAYHCDMRKTIPRNPLAGCRFVDEKPFQRQTNLSPEEVAKFLEPAPMLFRDICLVAYRSAGMRRSEAQLLRKAEIDWSAKVINLSAARNKNRTARSIPFPDDVMAILRLHCDISLGPYVFVRTADPKRFDPPGNGYMQYWLEKCRDLSGVQGYPGENIVVHALRHAGVTRLVQDGAPESFVKAAAGMSDVTFKRYTKFGRKQQDILREHMNRQVEPPTPINVQLLRGERIDAKSADRPRPTPASAAEE